MQKKFKTLGICLTLGLASLSVQDSALANQFTYLDPAYTQDIFTGPIATTWGPGFGWTSSGNMVLRSDSMLYEYSLTDNATYNGTAVRGVVSTYNIAGLSGGYGMTTGIDGNFYANTSAGVAKIDTTTWTATTYAGTAGGAYGIGTLADGSIIHNDNNNIWSLNPVTGVDTLLYTSPSFIDGIAIAPTGEVFLSDLGSWRVRIIDGKTGALINNQALSHGPDGMAFGNGAAYANNTDGTITKLTFSGPGYTGGITETIFASGGSYGDLAAVGPDGAFYVSQWGGINWDDDNWTSENAIIKISLTSGGGFTPPPGTGHPLPVPATLALLLPGLFLMFGRKK